MSFLPSTTRLAQLSARRPWWTVGTWVAVMILAVVVTGTIGMSTTNGFTFTNDPEAQTGATLLEDAGLVESDPTDETVVVHSDTLTVSDPAFQQRVESLTAELRSMPDVVATDTVTNYYELMADPSTAGAAGAVVSADGHTTLIPVTLAGDLDTATANAHDYLDDVEAFAGDGFEVFSVGPVSIAEESNVITGEDILRGETIGILAAIVILVAVFGALVAAGIPIILAVVSIVIASGVTALVSQLVDLSFFVTNIMVMLGLAVGIDYVLFVVERYREERRKGHPQAEAIAVAGGTASKAVTFSGGTVVLALMGMFLVPTSIFQSLAIGAIAVVVVAVVATLTLVPAVLSLLGDRIDWPRKHRYAEAVSETVDIDAVYRGFWGRMTRLVMARPLIGAVAATALLVAAAIPFVDINTGFSGAEIMPEDSKSRQAFEILDEQFSAGRLSPVQFAIEGDQDAVNAAVPAFREALMAQTVEDGNGGTEPAFMPIPEEGWIRWSEDGQVALLEVTLTTPANDDRSYDGIDRLREELVPAAFDGTGASVYVTGETASNQDYFEITNEYTPYVLAFVLGLSFILLLLAFRSVVVSAKAILMNLLSVGAAYGLMVLVFQKGVGNEFFGFQQTPTIEAWIPILLFCLLFGLSMDYHVFLLSRIREHYDLTGRNTESVAVGLHSTAKIITGAALIMVAVFGGFAAGRLVFLQQAGFGLGVAVLIDATIVRSVLVPSAMALLGDRNWYMPKWLRWLPDLRVEGEPVKVVHANEGIMPPVAPGGAPGE